jgi:hypothetical protein
MGEENSVNVVKTGVPELVAAVAAAYDKVAAVAKVCGGIMILG